MKRILLLISPLFLGLSACVNMQRSPASGYVNNLDQATSYQSVDDFYRQRSATKWDSAKEELGYADTSAELSEAEAQNVRLRIILKRLEDGLEYSVERKQYYGYKPYFKNDWDRIQFLRIPTRDAREKFAQSIGLSGTETNFEPGVISLIEKGDLAKNMTMKAVEQSWGEPEMKEVAGDQLYGNERWLYKKLVSTGDGYKQERRVIYFEAGRVAGWETY